MSADFIVPDRSDLVEVLAALGIDETREEFKAGMVMLAAGPAGGATWKINRITGFPEADIREIEQAMIREGVWPKSDKWLLEDDTTFALDLLCVMGKLKRIVYGSGEIKYVEPSYEFGAKAKP
jgi:hypothetical protein